MKYKQIPLCLRIVAIGTYSCHHLAPPHLQQFRHSLRRVRVQIKCLLEQYIS